MAQNAGGIFYTVDAKTEAAINGINKVADATDGLNKSFGKTDNAAARTSARLTQTAAAAREMANQANFAGRAWQGLGNTMGGVSEQVRSLAAAYLSIQGAKAVVTMADSYTNLQNRLRLVTDGQTQLAQATDSVFNIAQRTSQEVGTIAQVYQRFAQNAKELGINQATVASVTETVAKAVAISGAAAGSAEAGLTQFGQALASGVLRGEELNSVIEQTPGLAAAIAKGLGVTIGQLRALAAEGKITGQKLIEALGKAGDSVGEDFNTRIKTVGQSVTELQNNLMRFVGELTTSSGASTALASTITAISDNLTELAGILTSVGAGALAGYIAKLGLKTTAAIADIAASRAAAVQEVNLARAQIATAQATIASTRATVENAYTRGIAAKQADALAAAEARLAAAQRAGGTVMGLARGLLGGPVGIISLVATAATGMYLMRDGTDAAARSYELLNGGMADTIAKLELMTESQRRTATGAAQKALADATRDLNDALNDVARGPMVAGGQTRWAWIQFAGKEMENLNRQVGAGDITAQQYDKSVNDLADKFTAAGNGTAKWREAMQTLTGEASQAGVKFATASANSSRLAGGLDQIAAAAQNAAGGLRQVNAEAGRGGDPGKFLKSLEEGLGRLQDGGSKVKEATRQLAEWKTAGVDVGTNVSDGIMKAAIAYDKANAAARAVKTTTRAVGKEQSEAKQRAEENAKALDNLAKELSRTKLLGEELTAQSGADKLNSFAKPEEIERAKQLNAEIYKFGEQQKAQDALADIGRQLGLAGLGAKELAQAQAILSLGEYATPDQIESARQLAGQLFEINKQKELQKTVGVGGVEKYVKGDVKPLQGGAFDEQTARYDAEEEVEKQRFLDQQKRLEEMLDAKLLKNQAAFDLELKMYEDHSKRLQQIDQARYSTQLQTASSTFGEIADATKAFAGEQSGIYKAMFAVSKAFAIADAIVNINGAMAKAANSGPFPGNLAAMASVGSATAGLISAISGTSMGGGRQYGGPVGPNKMHRIHENGRPEILNAANGQQYLLPNTRGQVVSNRDATSGSGGSVEVSTAAPVTIQTNVYLSQAGAQTTTTTQGAQDNAGAQLGELISNAVKEQIQRERRPGGVLWNMQNGRA